MLRTQRLILRPFRPQDLPIYAAVNADPEVMRYLGGPLRRYQSDEQAVGANDSFELRGYGKIAVERAADNAFLGMCGLSEEPWYPGELEIGWRFAPQHWHQGYATEAAKAWLTYAFETLKRERVISIADVPNQLSISVMKRLGMALHHEAELSDDQGAFPAVIYSITAAQFRSGSATK